MKETAIKYYLRSFWKLITKTNFWIGPFTFFSQPQLMKLPGYKLLVRDLMDIWTVKEVMVDKQYLDPTIKEFNTVIDIGCGIGDFIILMAPYSTSVYGYDLSKNRIILAKRNIELNKDRFTHTRTHRTQESDKLELCYYEK